MRRGELFGLRWEDVNWQHNVIHVRQALYWKYGRHIRPTEGDLFVFIPPKSETSVREIDLSPALKAELRQRYLVSQKTGLVFCTAEGRPLDPNGFSKKAFALAVFAARLGKVRFHDVRSFEDRTGRKRVLYPASDGTQLDSGDDRYLRTPAGNKEAGSGGQN